MKYADFGYNFLESLDFSFVRLLFRLTKWNNQMNPCILELTYPPV